MDWYGDGKRSLDICTATALWYRSGSDPLPIRWVLTRDPEAQRPPIALFSTDQSQPAEEIVTDAHEALEPGDDVRRKPGVFRHRNTETMVGPGDSSNHPHSSLACTASLHSLGTPCILMGASRWHKPPGIANLPPQFVTCWRRFGDNCGVIPLFPPPPLIRMWLVPRSFLHQLASAACY